MKSGQPGSKFGFHEKIRVGVASCLLGNPVRFNAGGKFDGFIVNSLGRYFDWVPVCPEVEAGLGVPRESMQLRLVGGHVRLLTTLTKKDLTDKLNKISGPRAQFLLRENISGYIGKRASPSCGMRGVRVYRETGIPFNDGEGIFATALRAAMPNLPIEEEGRLKDPVLRENWIERVFAYHDIKMKLSAGARVGNLVIFHTRYKFALMAHSPEKYRKLGRLVADAAKMKPSEWRADYERQFMEILRVPATKKKHTDVMQHMLGYLKKELNPSLKRSFLAVLEDYRSGLYPLSVPLVMLKCFVERYEPPYLMNQVYLDPHPKELALRNFSA